MNDSFTSQNSAAFYQAPATPSIPTGSDDAVVMDAPTATPSTQPAQPGDDAAVQAYQPPTQPNQDPVQTNQPMQGDAGATDMPAVPTVTAVPPVAEPAHDQVSQTEYQSAKAEGVAKSSPEEVVRRLAERIKAYQARQAAPTSSSPVPPTAPTGAVVVNPAAPEEKNDAVDQVVSPSLPNTPKEVEEHMPSVSAAPITPTAPTTPTTSTNDLGVSTVDSQTTKSEESSLESDSEALDAQNIFELLGVLDGSDQEKDGFLDQLQQVIWEDFLENDVQLLLTKSEAAELEKLLGQENQSETDRQESAVVFLEKLIPDLESIMLEKALDLKREMVFERIAGMRELHGGKADILARITEAEVLFKQDKWQSGAKVLNAIK